MVPVDSRRVPRVPRYLGATSKLGLHFHIRGCHPLWPDFPDRSINTFQYLFTSTECTDLLCSPPAPSVNVCGPATPGSPFESPGLGCSEFARHYYRNHGCFLFLRVLRWFTSPGSLRTPMYSEYDNCCSQQLGFPIRTSPDHRLLASPRGLSQLATSFIAYLRQGIHTHALSSLTIKFTLVTVNQNPEARIHNSELQLPNPNQLLALH